MILHVLPLLVFTTFAGFAAGAYAVDAVCGNGREAKTPWLFPLVCVVLLGIGLCGTLAHLGQPLRFMNGMANPASGISQESYWAIALGIVIVVDLVISWHGGRALRQAGGKDGCGCSACPGVYQRGHCPLRVLRDGCRRVRNSGFVFVLPPPKTRWAARMSLAGLLFCDGKFAKFASCANAGHHVFFVPQLNTLKPLRRKSSHHKCSQRAGVAENPAEMLGGKWFAEGKGKGWQVRRNRAARGN